MDDDIAREPAEPEPRQYRPRDPGDQDQQPKPDQKALYVHP
jgi:hypothetical protein